MKKLMLITLFVLTAFTLSACTEGEDTIPIDLSVTSDTISMNVGERVNLAYDTNDTNGVTVSTDSELLTIEGNTLTAVADGEATVTITSKTDDSVFIEVTVIITKVITLDVDEESLTLKEDDTAQLTVTSNDGYVFESSNTDIVVVDEDGLITAKEVGTATVTVTSTYDNDVYEEIEVTVLKRVTLDVTSSNLVVVEGLTKTIDYTTNDTLNFVSSDPNIASVSSDGVITGEGYGETTIRITSESDPSIEVDVNVMVYKYTEEISIEGNETLIVGMESEYLINPSPAGAFTDVEWSTNDEEILTVNSEGIVTGESVGSASLIATSLLDNTIVATYDITVINASVVDPSSTSEDTYMYMGVELSHGDRLYSDLQSALDDATEDTLIYLETGTYSQAITIDKDGITLKGGTNAIITNTLTINANDVIIDHVMFEAEALLRNTVEIIDFTFINNIVQNTTSLEAFLLLDGIDGVVIEDNLFQQMSNDSIQVTDFIDGHIYIKNNSFATVENAISITADRDYAMTSEINILWNTIDQANTAFYIDLEVDGTEKAIEKYARFNIVKNATVAVESTVNNEFDFTLNYWNCGCTELEMSKFINIDPFYLRGFYVVEEQVLTESEYNPELPVLIIVDNPIDQIMIGETHTFEYSVLPMELDADIQFITGNPDILAINQEGEITPLKSGNASIYVRSRVRTSIKTEVELSIVTTPGIALTPSNTMNDITVGDTFTLNASPFPATVEGETVSYTSSDDLIATIDQDGIVTAHSEGLVTFTAYLDSDNTVTNTFTTYVYDALDPSNLLDYLTMNQVTYSTMHEWVVYGFQYNYNDRRYESVSHYYFGDIEVNDTKLIPPSYKNRPGLMTQLPSDITPYNDDNIYWVVVHDTASTATGSNALAHANWLYNSEQNVSWHYSIDDTYTYQHLPDIERGWHAGDGSTLPGEGSYLGGGNRNGIGIEMAVNDDGDVYRTWQRTAKLVVDLLVEHNLPISQQKYHNDFSGKDCPNTLRNAGLIPLFEEFVDTEYHVATNHSDAEIVFSSNNPEYLDNHGRVIRMPDRAMTVSYTITVTEDGVTESRTFYTYLPGTVR